LGRLITASAGAILSVSYRSATSLWLGLASRRCLFVCAGKKSLIRYGLFDRCCILLLGIMSLLCFLCGQRGLVWMLVRLLFFLVGAASGGMPGSVELEVVLACFLGGCVGGRSGMGLVFFAGGGIRGFDGSCTRFLVFGRVWEGAGQVWSWESVTVAVGGWRWTTGGATRPS
jgi:hypothetical protein